MNLKSRIINLEGKLTIKEPRSDWMCWAMEVMNSDGNEVSSWTKEIVCEAFRQIDIADSTQLVHLIRNTLAGVQIFDEDLAKRIAASLPQRHYSATIRPVSANRRRKD